MDHALADSTDEAKGLTEVVTQIVEARRQKGERCIPAWIAAEAMAKIDPDRICPEPVRYGCIQTFRWIACRVLGVPDETEADLEPFEAPEKLRAAAERMLAHADALENFFSRTPSAESEHPNIRTPL
jgi:hypothetical protein